MPRFKSIIFIKIALKLSYFCFKFCAKKALKIALKLSYIIIALKLSYYLGAPPPAYGSWGHAPVNYCFSRVLVYAKMLKETKTEETIGLFVTFLLFLMLPVSVSFDAKRSFDAKCSNVRMFFRS